MFGAKSSKGPSAKLIHMNFSAETVMEKNFEKLKEYCHITYDQDGWIQHTIVDASTVKYTVTDDYIEPMVSISATALSGMTKGVEIFIPRNCDFNLL